MLRQHLHHYSPLSHPAPTLACCKSEVTNTTAKRHIQHDMAQIKACLEEIAVHTEHDKAQRNRGWSAPLAASL